MLISRANPLLIEWADDSWTIHHVRAETSYRVSRDVLRFLECVGDGIGIDDLPKTLDEDQAVIDEQVRQLLDLGVVRKDMADPGASESDVVLRSLGMTAKHFHTATRDANFLITDSADSIEYSKKVSGEGRPSFTKEYPQAPLLPLPRVFASLNMNLRDVLQGRRTHREFSSEPVSIDQLATALHYTFAPLRFTHNEYWGTIGLKASASGGARNEAEAYVVPLHAVDADVATDTDTVPG
ncbi:hypothetical protein AB0M44_35865 [Streptosporangium subroseum]|uniref:hypothetical protein n=1 Tax=Streptosporangium subroseum TaxID=106412 RepID=UPI00343207E4